MDLVISSLLDVLSNTSMPSPVPIQSQDRAHIAEVLIIIHCCRMAGTSSVPGAGVLLHELACVSHSAQCATLAGAGGSKLDMALVMPRMAIV